MPPSSGTRPPQWCTILLLIGVLCRAAFRTPPAFAAAASATPGESSGASARTAQLEKASQFPEALGINPTVEGNAPLASSNVLMQGFNWDSASNPIGWYTVLKSQLPKICSSGVSSVWLPPPSQSGDEGGASKRHGYQPQNWYNLTSDYGSARDLEDLLRGLRACGIQPIADIVINHRQAVEQVVSSSGCSCSGCPGATWTAFKNPNWTNTEVVSDAGSPCGACHQCRSTNCCPPGKAVFCGTGNADTGDRICSFPDIDHTSPKVQNDVIDWLRWLKVGDFSGEQRVAPGEALGFQGWRFDMVKGYAPRFIGKYLEKTGFDWAVGEYFDYDEPDELIDWVHGTGDKAVAFDFPLRKSLKIAIEGDDFSGLGFGMSSVTSRDSWKAVPFIDNHDTARIDGGGGWPWASTSTGSATENILTAYVYILSHPSNTPVVFWTDWSDRAGLKEPLEALIALRKSAGISGGSSVYVDQHQPHLYTARITGSFGKLLVKLGSTYPWSPSDTGYWGSQPHLSGKNWAIWWRQGVAI